MGNVVAVIPARGGSKGLPGKNILLLMGKSVLVYTVEAALQARSLDRVILSTDSEEIAEVGRLAGAEVLFMRPAELATDSAHPTAVLEHAVTYLEETEGYITELVVTLQPTSPLRVSSDIDDAVQLLQNNGEMDSVITIMEVGLPPYWVLRTDGPYLRPFIDDGTDYSLMRRQELEQTYRPNGAVYVTRRELLKNRGLIFSAFSQGKTGYVLMDPIRSLDIDTQTDFTVIESILKDRQPGE
jgi:CMP-N,N'-diacetyllegionaminic acid synthase